MDGFGAGGQSDLAAAGSEASDDGLRDLVVDLSTNLMSAAPDEFDTKLRWEVRRVADRVDADRGYVLAGADDGFEASAAYAESAEEAVDVDGLLADDGWLVERLRRFDPVVVSDVADLPPEATALADGLRDAGARSAVFLPIVSDWTMRGVLGLDAGRPREWDPSTVDLLESVAELIGHSQARVRRERQLRRQNERLEAFAGMVSHDLRNPLTVVSAAVDAARTRDDPSHLDRAAEAADRMDQMVDRILTLVRAGQDIGETRRVGLTHVVDEAWTTVDPGDMALSRPDDLGTVEADAGRLREVFENLFRNADEHAGSATTVRVGRLADDDGIFVADDGPGLPDGESGALFDQGYSTDGGTGLGLAIVCDVAEAHSWTVSARESADGGARFEFDGLSFVD